MSGDEPHRLPAWQALAAHRRDLAQVHMGALFERDPARFDDLSVEACDLFLDYSKNRVSRETLSLLLALAREADVEGWRDAMFAGNAVNTSEHRAALHVALRHPCDGPFPDAVRDVTPAVGDARRRMGALAAALREGRRRGHSGEVIDSLVHLGIGGSRLGPEMVADALAPDGGPVTLRFASSIDVGDLRAALRGLAPARTLFVVASKTFTTQETLANADSARAWLLGEGGLPEAAVADHFVAVTAAGDRARAYGIPDEGVLPVWDWVGGRYSVCSAVGLPAAVAAGMDAFEEMLAGAWAMDRHFREAPLAENMPVILGLLGVWYRDFLGAATRAVLPYDHRLRGLPAYLQQLEMESAGKRVGRDGTPLGVATCPVVWGGPGNDAQHSFFQLLHQGTELVPCDILVPARGTPPDPRHDDGVLANALAQAEALMVGRDEAATRAALTAAGLDRPAIDAELPHRVFPGNQPTNTLLYESLTPRHLGALIALYEHRLLVQSACWGLNPFDQWGVELGKALAGTLAREIEDGKAGPHDGSTAGLLARASRMRSRA